MATEQFTQYSATPASNSSAPPVGAPEGMFPSAVNDTMREMMAVSYNLGLLANGMASFFTTTNSGSVYTIVSIPNAPTTVTIGYRIYVQFNVAPPSGATLGITGINTGTAYPIVYANGLAIVAGEIGTTEIVPLIFNGTQWQLEKQSATVASSLSFSVASSALTINYGLLSLVVPATATLGHASGLANRIYYYLVYNGTANVLSASCKFFGMSGTQSTTAMSTSATSATVMYSTNGYTNASFTCIGYSEDTQTTAGIWASVPSLSFGAPFTRRLGDVRAYLTSTQSIPASTPTVLGPMTEIFDVDGDFNNATQRMYVKEPMILSTFFSHFYNATNATASALFGYIYKNGSMISQKAFIQNSGTSGGQGCEVQDDIKMLPGDYLEAWVQQQTVSSNTLNAASYQNYVVYSGRDVIYN